MGFDLNKAESWTTIYTIIGVVVFLLGILAIFLVQDVPVDISKNQNYFGNIFYGFRPSVIKNNKLFYIILAAYATFCISIQIFMPYLILYYNVSLGNPHCVIFTNTLSDDLILFYGKAIENHPLFPNGTNVEFARVIRDDEIRMRVWERGIGETLSCSTGSCAVIAAAKETTPISDIVDVVQPGGVINVETRACGNMFITGNCNTVFTGTFNE